MSQMNNDIDALLDGTLDDLADIPEFVVPNPGSWIAEIISFETKEINKMKSPELKLKFTELIEAADESLEPQALPLEAGTLYSFFYEDGKPNEFAQGSFKEIIAALKPVVGGDKNSEVMANSKGAMVAVTTGVRLDKKDSTKRYLQIKQLTAA